MNNSFSLFEVTAKILELHLTIFQFLGKSLFYFQLKRFLKIIKIDIWLIKISDYIQLPFFYQLTEVTFLFTYVSLLNNNSKKKFSTREVKLSKVVFYTKRVHVLLYKMFSSGILHLLDKISVRFCLGLLFPYQLFCNQEWGFNLIYASWSKSIFSSLKFLFFFLLKRKSFQNSKVSKQAWTKHDFLTDIHSLIFYLFVSLNQTNVKTLIYILVDGKLFYIYLNFYIFFLKGQKSTCTLSKYSLNSNF